MFKKRHFYNINCLYPIYNGTKHNMYNMMFDDIPDIFDISLIWKILLEEKDIIKYLYTEKIVKLLVSAGIEQKICDIILNRVEDQENLRKLHAILRYSYSFKNCGCKIFVSDYISRKHPHLIENNETR